MIHIKNKDAVLRTAIQLVNDGAASCSAVRRALEHVTFPEQFKISKEYKKFLSRYYEIDGRYFDVAPLETLYRAGIIPRNKEVRLWSQQRVILLNLFFEDYVSEDSNWISFVNFMKVIFS